MGVGLFGKTWRVVAESLKLRLARNDVIAANIANVDTPGYRRKVLPFEKIMQAYLKGEPKLETTNPRHIKPTPFEPPVTTETDWTPPDEGTPNNVSLEDEMARLTENTILYQATIQALMKELQILKDAITEGGKG